MTNYIIYTRIQYIATILGTFKNKLNILSGNWGV